MILGLIDHDRGKLNKLSLEMLTLARQLAQDVSCALEAVLMGQDSHALAEQLAEYGVSKVYLVEHDRLDDYAPEAWAHSLMQIIAAAKPQAVLSAGSERGNEVLAHVAARSDLALASNCTAIQPGDVYQLTRVRWGGSLLEECQLQGSPKLLTTAPHTVEPEAVALAGELVVQHFSPTLTDKDFRVRISSRVEKDADTVSLTDARIVVSGGRGVGSSAGFESLEELAALVEGAIGCSRAVTNEGWRPHADQVGQTGARIAPDVYFACGISGAIQHYVGCKGAKTIIVINTDPEAPIIAKADYAVIGDLHEVVPAIAAELKKVKA